MRRTDAHDFLLECGNRLWRADGSAPVVGVRRVRVGRETLEVTTVAQGHVQTVRLARPVIAGAALRQLGLPENGGEHVEAFLHDGGTGTVEHRWADLLIDVGTYASTLREDAELDITDVRRVGDTDATLQVTDAAGRVVADVDVDLSTDFASLVGMPIDLQWAVDDPAVLSDLEGNVTLRLP